MALGGAAPTVAPAVNGDNVNLETLNQRSLNGADPLQTEIQPKRKPLDANRYATKKTVAQGMLDVALLTANASQLRYVLQVGDQHEFYTLMVTLITVSIVLQVVVGLLSLSLNLLHDCRLHREDLARSANAINYTSLALVFSVTTVNVLISAFDVRPVPSPETSLQIMPAP